MVHCTDFTRSRYYTQTLKKNKERFMKKFLFSPLLSIVLASFTGCASHETVDRIGQHCE